MTDADKITVADIARERSIARIFEQYADYAKSLPARVWFQTDAGTWGSKPR